MSMKTPNRRRRFADVTYDQDSPLSVAVSTRDRSTLDMVAAAIRHKQTMLAFQPIHQARPPHKVAFYEGPIRVLDAAGRVIPAAEFMPHVEDTELGRQLDCLALEAGLRTLSKTPDIRLSVNMSARSIGYDKWNRVLDRHLARDPRIAERLILEITESSAMTVPEIAIDFMDRLSLKGISFALDDFGAGHTSIRYFRDFFFDMVKIDGQFIKGIHANPDNQAITAALVSIAKQFDMFTIAEFVESKADADCLLGLGVDCLQGYYFAAPTVRPPWQKSFGNKMRA